MHHNTILKMSDAESVQSTKLCRTYENECIESVKQLYLNAETADVHFSFDSNNAIRQPIAAHKILLAASSDVFKTMFYGKTRLAGDIHMPKVSDAAFMEFLQYFYLNKVELSAEHIDDVLYLGQKYNVKRCVTDCLEFVASLINNENVCGRLQLAIQHEQLELVKICRTHILLNSVAVFKSAGFLACDRQVLAHILKMPLLSCSEVKVFEAIMMWVKVKSKTDTLTNELIQTHLGELFHDIRFASMKIEEFCILAMKYASVFLSADFQTIATMIALSDWQSGGKLGCSRFNRSARRAKWNSDAIVHCNREVGGEKMYKLDPEQLVIFSTNVPLLLGTFTCARIMVKDAQAEAIAGIFVEVKIGEFCDFHSQNINGIILTKMTAKLQAEQTTVSLPQPILIRPGFFYLIEIGPFPKAHYFQSSELKKQVDLDCGNAVMFHKCAKTGADKRVVGFIPRLEFNEIPV